MLSGYMLARVPDMVVPQICTLALFMLAIALHAEAAHLATAEATDGIALTPQKLAPQTRE